MIVPITDFDFRSRLNVYLITFVLTHFNYFDLTSITFEWSIMQFFTSIALPDPDNHQSWRHNLNYHQCILDGCDGTSRSAGSICSGIRIRRIYRHRVCPFLH
jgi:hypothetical protein